jgi:predicted transcriptional regulator
VFSIVKGSFHKLSSGPVPRRIFVGIRLDPELKEALEEIAETEERSVSQICELLLRRGIDAYQAEGSKYLRALARHRKKESPE